MVSRFRNARKSVQVNKGETASGQKEKRSKRTYRRKGSMILCHWSFKSDRKQNGFDQFSPSSECVHSFASCSCFCAYVHALYIHLVVSHARNSKFVRFRSISTATERRFVVSIGAERRPTVFVMARWFERIVVKKSYIRPSFFLLSPCYSFSPRARRVSLCFWVFHVRRIQYGQLKKFEVNLTCVLNISLEPLFLVFFAFYAY